MTKRFRKSIVLVIKILLKIQIQSTKIQIQSTNQTNYKDKPSVVNFSDIKQY